MIKDNSSNLKKLEEKLEIKLKKIENIFDNSNIENGYEIKDDKVIGLKLKNLNLKEIPNIVLEFYNLERINFSNNQIKNIEHIKELTEFVLI